jgi:hypothetical protein
MAEEVGQARLQTLGHLFDVHKRDVPYPALDTAVVGPVDATALGCLFLIDSLRLTYATNGTAEPNPDIDGHHLESSRCSDDEYTLYESH